MTWTEAAWFMAVVYAVAFTAICIRLAFEALMARRDQVRRTLPLPRGSEPPAPTGDMSDGRAPAATERPVGGAGPDDLWTEFDFTSTNEGE